MNFLRLFMFLFVFKVWALYCDYPNPRNTVVINMAFEYKNSNIALQSKTEDLNFFDQVASSMGVAGIRIVDKDVSSKEALIERLKKIADGKTHVYFNYAGHGERFHGEEEWAITLPLNLAEEMPDPTKPLPKPVFLTHSELMEIFKDKNIYFLIDSCYSGCLARNLKARPGLNTCALCSSGPEEASWENPKLNPSSELVQKTEEHHQAAQKFLEKMEMKIPDLGIEGDDSRAAMMAYLQIELRQNKEADIENDADFQVGAEILNKHVKGSLKKEFDKLKSQATLLRNRWDRLESGNRGALIGSLQKLEIPGEEKNDWVSLDEIGKFMDKKYTRSFANEKQSPELNSHICTEGFKGGYPKRLFSKLKRSGEFASSEGKHH